MTGCTFCRIVQGELPAVLVHEDERSLAFLDHRPLFPGHTLVIPRTHVATLAELPEDLLGPLFHLVQHLSRALPQA
ncbi:MAG: HIT domain-containing protein, partial [Thermomicrobium sp.]|nr:HIT domain-containing protein [Thermomicrobium sp.]